MTAAINVTGDDLSFAIVATARERDAYWRATLSILTAGCGWRFAHEPRIWRHVDVWESVATGDLRIIGFDFDAMIAAGWTAAESVMVRAAAALFDGSASVDINELLRVDQGNHKLLLDAIATRRHDRPWTAGFCDLVFRTLGTVEPVR